MPSIDRVDAIPESRRRTLLQAAIDSGSTSLTMDEGLQDAERRIALARAAVEMLTGAEIIEGRPETSVDK